jgi:endonuclease YncB( thermonuclease family)
VIAARIHPGYAVLAVVAGVTAALLILQSMNHRDVATASAPVPPVAPSMSPGAPSLAPAARAPPALPLSGIARVIDGDTIEVRGTHIRSYWN